jgi:N-acetyl-alpha-D-glucosaminyl L-malate synthase BshA
VVDCVRILAAVVKQTPAHLLMAGDGPDRWPAEQMARDLGVDKHITFLGKQDHVERLIRLAHVLLMPSEMESFGLASLEGMACGVPPIATRVGGVPELITDGEDGFLSAVGDIEAQAAKTVTLLTDDALHARMSARARQTAVSRFATDRIIPQYEEVYRELIG